jgi:hypothetical protein
VAVVVPARRRHARVREVASSPLRVAAVAVAAIPFLVHAWVALHGYFGQDDFVMVYRAGHADLLDPGYLFQDYNGHVVPGLFVLAWLETSIAPLNYTVAVLPLLAMHAVALVLFWRVLAGLFGYRWANLPAFAVLAASPLILYPTLWWAYAMQFLPLLVAMAGALLAHLAYLESGKNRYASLAWTAGGLLFFEKAALFAAILFAVTVLMGGTVSDVLVRHWRVWTAHVTLIAVYGAAYVVLTASQTAASPVPASALAELVRSGIVDTFLPGIFGGLFAAPQEATGWVTPPLVIRIAALVLTAAIIVFSRKAKPWLVLGGYLVVDLGLVAVTRLTQLGPGVGADPRYLADAVPVAVICAAFAFQHRRDRQWHSAGIAALLVVAGVASFLRVAPGLQFREARDYVATAREAFALQPGIALFDNTVPDPVILDWFFGENLASRVVSLVPEAPAFDRAAETLYQLDDHGSPQPITELDNVVRGEKGPAPDCGHLVTGTPVRIPLTYLSYGHRVLKLGYYTGDTGDGVITVGDTRAPVKFREGLHVLYVPITGTYTHVSVSWNKNLQPLCVTDITIGDPER